MATILPHPELASTLPDADLNVLTGLSDTSQVLKWTEHKVSEHKNYISTLLAIHNSITPINKLPTEILREVFAHVPNHRRWCSVFWMLSLQSVCRRWWSVLLATPRYWVQGFYHAMVLSAENEEASWYFRHLFLSRSAPCPLELTMSYTLLHGWQIFEDVFGDITFLEVKAASNDDLLDIIFAARQTMKCLEWFELDVELFPMSREWPLLHPGELPRLKYFKTDVDVFSWGMAVPSLRTIVLIGEQEIGSIPELLDELEKCLSLETLRLHVGSDHLEPDALVGDVDMAQGAETCDYTIDLPNLRTFVLDVSNVIGHQLVLPNALPRRIPSLNTSPTINRLLLRSPSNFGSGAFPPVIVQGYLQGVLRLQVEPASWLHDAHQFAQFLDAFGACAATELAVDLHHAPSNNMNASEFWGMFFAALPHLRRLELLSPNAESRAVERAVAAHFLASSRAPDPQRARRGWSLVWVLCRDASSPSQLELELGDVEHILGEHACQGARCYD